MVVGVVAVVAVVEVVAVVAVVVEEAVVVVPVRDVVLDVRVVVVVCVVVVKDVEVRVRVVVGGTEVVRRVPAGVGINGASRGVVAAAATTVSNAPPPSPGELPELLLGTVAADWSIPPHPSFGRRGTGADVEVSSAARFASRLFFTFLYIA